MSYCREENAFYIFTCNCQLDFNAEYTIERYHIFKAFIVYKGHIGVLYRL